jgi:RNA polymerase sigma-70 factor (ECF subfamily)
MTEKDFVLKIPETLNKTKNFLAFKFKLHIHDINDILQNASLKAYKNLPFFREKCSFDTWFISIAKNEAKTFLLKRSKTKTVDDSEEFLKDYSFKWIEPEVNSKEEHEDVSLLLNEIISDLSSKHRVVIDLFLKDHSSKEISSILNIPINSVRTRIFYARKKLKNLILTHGKQ